MKIKVKETGEFIKTHTVYWNVNKYKEVPDDWFLLTYLSTNNKKNINYTERYVTIPQNELEQILPNWRPKTNPDPEYAEDFICDEPAETTALALYFENNSDEDFREGKPIYVDDEVIKQYDYFKQLGNEEKRSKLCQLNKLDAQEVISHAYVILKDGEVAMKIINVRKYANDRRMNASVSVEFFEEYGVFEDYETTAYDGEKYNERDREGNDKFNACMDRIFARQKDFLEKIGIKFSEGNHWKDVINDNEDFQIIDIINTY